MSAWDGITNQSTTGMKLPDPDDMIVQSRAQMQVTQAQIARLKSALHAMMDFYLSSGHVKEAGVYQMAQEALAE